jgi:hypothetical protein
LFLYGFKIIYIHFLEVWTELSANFRKLCPPKNLTNPKSLPRKAKLLTHRRTKFLDRFSAEVFLPTVGGWLFATIENS